MRPRRHETPAVRLTAWVSEQTKARLTAEAARLGISVGELLDGLNIPTRVEARPMLSLALAAGRHVCTKWRYSEARSMQVCVDDDCQKPKHR